MAEAHHSSQGEHLEIAVLIRLACNQRDDRHGAQSSHPGADLSSEQLSVGIVAGTNEQVVRSTVCIGA